MLQGKELTGVFNSEPFWLGSHRYLVERGQGTPETVRQVNALEADGKTVVAVGNPRHVCGLIAVADTVRPEARDIVKQLHIAGIVHVVMPAGAAHAGRTLAVIRQNIVFSLGVKSLFVVMTFTGMASLWARLLRMSAVTIGCWQRAAVVAR